MRKTILDIPIDWIDTESLLTTLEGFITSGKPHQITTVNTEFLVLSQENKAFNDALQNSDLSVPDSTGVVVGQTFLDQKYPRNKLLRTLIFIGLSLRHLLFPTSFNYKRITGVDLTELIMQQSAKKGWKIFLLGAAPGVAEKAALVWQMRYPDVKIVGVSDSNPQDAGTVKEVTAAKSDVLLVAYGAPKQDLFIAQHKKELAVPIMVGVGGTFDYAAGVIKRAPGFIRFLGLEWLARLLQQPKRFKRIWRATVGFMQKIIA